MVVKERELKEALGRLKEPPKLVVTDSQAFLKVAADTPPDVPMTSFSILFARFKGDLTTQVAGTMAVENLRSGDRVLVGEACSHHPIGEDIGRVKIPRWLTQYVGGKLDFETVQGHDFPDDLTPYKLVIHCGACTINRREMLRRIVRCREQGVPITNYGLVIAYSLGIFERALSRSRRRWTWCAARWRSHRRRTTPSPWPRPASARPASPTTPAERRPRPMLWRADDLWPRRPARRRRAPADGRRDPRLAARG